MAEVKPAGGAKAKRDIFAGDDPYALARAWLTEAEATELNDPSAAALATADKWGLPNVRMVLLKEIEANQAKGGFVFYTNHESAKGRELAENPQAALVMHWKSLRRQVRVRGPVEPAPAAMSDAYYNSRAYQSRIGAWASRQSRPLRSRAALMADVAKYAARFPMKPPRPPHWGGYRIRPIEIEFWADGDFRLHDRFRWTRVGPKATEWKVERLNP
ncbi:pyridoxamine 5'-phosphate oxidase [Pikeienuella piscinae]|uniref:Pyridoxine/pyridoxamine 5'-phosphate oxidase n=1 Tax=Pikeienuella piscinae TaxID=2748098 RepID=A0A7L5BW29_9RHOB|nr:pyridoxamine 5'-phosphate oxidase [Pikeienuella piscinae]QIE54084.1 pyridoxamine 5'-phosphate oxidase [Pikeienuella piscinae]